MRLVFWSSNRWSTNSSDLHWLPIEWRIKFKIACITYKSVSTTQPAYLHSVLKYYVPSRALRSSGSNLLFVPRVSTGFGSHSFSVAGPIIWNFFPWISYSKQFYHILLSLKPSFTKQLFGSLVPHPTPPHPSTSASAGQWPTLCALQIHFLTYLITPQSTTIIQTVCIKYLLIKIKFNNWLIIYFCKTTSPIIKCTSLQDW